MSIPIIFSYNDKLLFQRNEKTHVMFSKNPDHNKADENWSKLQQAASN